MKNLNDTQLIGKALICSIRKLERTKSEGSKGTVQNLPIERVSERMGNYLSLLGQKRGIKFQASSKTLLNTNYERV